MNKKIIIGTAASVIILGGAIGAGAMTDQFKTVGIVNPEPAEQSELISLDEAKEKALAEYEGVVESVELEKQFKGYIYEIDIDNGEYDWELDMDASTGEILKAKEERDDDWNETSSNNQTDDNGTASAIDSNTASSNTNEEYISQEEAVKIAMAQVSGTLESVELDEDDGRMIYEIEINKDKDDDAEVDIDAVTGEIIEIDLD
ncbi:PepSY domain-containing protein [Jeotgalibacillus proteolyticus]|uniref:Peptidase n=1 Tax=Jeotgalibacillus proteolyticus TaxID=2082395 RepID=A0A2S5G9G1_9BACL|nr:PepSY domain-containing protein [Jeotgalibacillus proteolyticus]PPA69575.1 peptidase [Jeotgalibacillus proteolyticus]